MTAGTVIDQLNDADTIYSQKLSSDDEHFDLVIDCLLFLARQDMAFRGHSEADDSTNKGNFLELHKLLLSYNDRLQAAYNNAEFKMLSPKVQNMVLHAAAKAAIKLVKLELGEHQKYAVLADGTRDRDPVSCVLYHAILIVLEKLET